MRRACCQHQLSFLFLVGRQNTHPHCSGTFTGYAYRSESSFGCVFWHITVCTAQHRRVLQIACGRHQSSSPVTICRHDSAAGAADSSGNSWRPRLSGGSGAAMEQSASTKQGRLVAVVFSAADKGPSVSAVIQLTSEVLTTVPSFFFINLICKVPL